LLLYTIPSCPIEVSTPLADTILILQEYSIAIAPSPTPKPRFFPPQPRSQLDHEIHPVVSTRYIRPTQHSQTKATMASTRAPLRAYGVRLSAATRSRTGQLPWTTANRSFAGSFHGSSSSTLRRGTAVRSLLPLISAYTPSARLPLACSRRALASVSHPSSSPSNDASSSDPTITTDTLVIGAGPGGLTAVACMLDNGAPS